MNKKNPKVDFYFEKAGQWHSEFTKLRSIALACGLSEELKWGHPCYTSDGGNIVLMHGFKEYCAFLFFKGVLLKDPKAILVRQTESVQAGRQIRFTSVGQITKLEPVLKSYIREAIEVEKAGLKVVLKKSPDPVPDELQSEFDKMPALKAAFASLTPGRQRAYILHINGAKQSKTRTSRVEKWIPQILNGKGLDDE